MQTIDIDDLCAPRLTPVQQAIRDETDQHSVDLDVNDLLNQAADRSGLDDFGADTGFRDRLEAHVAAINADTGSTNLNRSTLRERIVRLLENRLRLTELLTRYPEIHEIEIEKPFIVVGMPRSGTTHLVNLIARDHRRRALPFWESQEPFPAHGAGPDNFGVDPRFRRCTAEHEMVSQLSPYLSTMHDRFPEAIEEEVELLDLDFAGYTLEWHARVPMWRDYYFGLDHYDHYSYLKTVLQALTFLRGPRMWVLKSPQHSEQLGPLAATFPDATVAFTHRDPVAVIQSAITMLAYGDRMRQHTIDPEWLVDYWTDRVEHLLRACVRDRKLIPEDKSVDISFHHLNGNEMPLLEELYRRGDVELTPQVCQSFQDYLASNPRGNKGRIRYHLQRNFGRSASEIRNRFAFYFERFDVREEEI